ncbi:DUF4156 domain-containing protein [Thiomicrorhabdus sp. 6S2-11]|uniref:DUF4156 domain-containing protein n=1 Tax=Thiomicrorhabdus marina TaxID=2818442 RepID=A0ABS3Q276_9GAMM|nr:DUF4156 domain-containing protein [Thiomicrorhabdus marina]MBO1925945.1 DUF4156 domain-containing protein [Thiomicrorhabdus marina]
MFQTKSFSKNIISMLAVSTVLLMSACSWVEPLDGVDQVKVVTLPDVLRCEKLGSVNTSVLNKIGFINRDKDAVMYDSIALAKNEAVRMAGNRLVAVETIQDGHMRFDVYQCR